MRAFALLAVLVLLAGCADSGGKGGDDDSDSTSTSRTGTSGTRTATSSGSTSATGTDGPNTPPTANVTADVDNGTAPLVVNFTLNGTDADGDALNWTFDADGDGTPEANGTTLPATVQHTYNETGEFRAALNVTDGNASVTAFRLVVVAEGGEASGLVERDEYFWEPATGMCHAKEYEELGPGVYESGYGGGTWIIVEDNDVEGLQFENNHPLADVPNSGAAMTFADPCTDGDQVAF